MSLNSLTINKAIGKLVKKHIDADLLTATALEQTVVQVLDLLGYLGVLNYSLFDPEKVESMFQNPGCVLEVETLDKDQN